MSKAAVLMAIGALGLAPAIALARPPPVVVELFTAQGCASCDAADGLIAKLADQTGVVGLTFAVDYWDYLGWKDTFAQPEFADRQRAYARRLGLQDVYTPQVVVGGAAQVSGDDASAVADLTAKARRAAPPAPRIEFGHAGRIAVGVGRAPRGGAEVWLIRYEPHPKPVEVKAGDNRGAKITEANVVRQAVRLGRWTGRAKVYKTPPADEAGLKALVLVQEADGGPILGAREKP
jgi:hypothetical protein